MNYFAKDISLQYICTIELRKEVIRLITFVSVKTNENFMERQKCQKGSYAFNKRYAVLSIYVNNRGIKCIYSLTI